MKDNKIIVQVDKTVVKITGLSVKGLNISQLESLIFERLKSAVRIIGVTGEQIEMDVYGIDEADILRQEDGIIKAVALADGITVGDLTLIESARRIKSVDFDSVPEYKEGRCMGERWLDV